MLKCIIPNNIVDTRYCFRFSSSLNGFNSHSNLTMWVIILSLFLQKKKGRVHGKLKSHNYVHCYPQSHISKFFPYSYLFSFMGYPTILRWYLLWLLQRHVDTSSVIHEINMYPLLNGSRNPAMHFPPLTFSHMLGPAPALCCLAQVQVLARTDTSDAKDPSWPKKAHIDLNCPLPHLCEVAYRQRSVNNKGFCDVLVTPIRKHPHRAKNLTPNSTAVLTLPEEEEGEIHPQRHQPTALSFCRWRTEVMGEDQDLARLLGVLVGDRLTTQQPHHNLCCDRLMHGSSRICFAGDFWDSTRKSLSAQGKRSLGFHGNEKTDFHPHPTLSAQKKVFFYTLFESEEDSYIDVI